MEGGQVRPSDLFERECAFYMSIGMSYDDYWNGPSEMTRAYRKAYELRTQRRNQEMWLQGRYIYDALLAASPMFRTSFKGGRIKPEPYTKEPYPITEIEREARAERERAEKEEKLKNQFRAFAEAFRVKQEGEHGRP